MNRYPVWFIIAVLTITGCKNNNIEINGKLINHEYGKYIYLDELRSTELLTVDSSMVNEDGTFYFVMDIRSPSFYLLKTDETNFLTMLLEPGQKIKISAHSDSLNYPIYISGSEGTEIMAEYNRRLRKTIKDLSGLRETYMQNLGSPRLALVMENLDSLAQSYLNEINAYTKKFIDDNLSSLVSLVALYQQVAPGEYILHYEKDLSYFLKVDSSLSLLYPDYEPVKTLHNQVRELITSLDARNPVSPISLSGTEAPDIALPNPEGDTIRLSSMRGKIVLLDFWASWCTPCRKENPNLIKAYELFNDKGFEIYQVSLDKTKEAWVNGITKDKLEKWKHVSDVKYWNSAVVPLYNIDRIPTSYLIDRDGRIIGSNLRGEALQNKLAEIFKN